MRIPLELDTTDRRLAFDLFDGTNSLKVGVTAALPGDATLIHNGLMVRKAFGIPETLQLIVDVSISVNCGLVANWLYEKLKSRPVERLTINRRVVTTVTKEQIQQVLEEEIRRG